LTPASSCPTHLAQNGAIYVNYKATAEADFVVTDWTQEETEVPGNNTHLWEESWDDDDTSEDFSAQLKYVSILHAPHTLNYTSPSIISAY